MPGDCTVQHPHLPLTITFREAPHTYTDSQGATYTSATSLKKAVFSDFEPLEAARRACTRDGVPESHAPQYLTQWEAKRDAACTYGTKMHNLAELQTLHRMDPGSNPAPPVPESVDGARAIYAANMIADRYTILAPELIVYSPALLACGTIDLLAYDPQTSTFWILDYKTNASRKLAADAPVYRQGLPPYHHLPDTPRMQYALQLSIYEYLMRLEGYVAPDATIRRALVTLPSDQPQLYPGIIELPDLSAEVHHLFTTRNPPQPPYPQEAPNA